MPSHVHQRKWADDRTQQKGGHCGPPFHVCRNLLLSLKQLAPFSVWRNGGGQKDLLRLHQRAISSAVLEHRFRLSNRDFQSSQGCPLHLDCLLHQDYR
jgi:hypothetical protein